MIKIGTKNEFGERGGKMVHRMVKRAGGFLGKREGKRGERRREVIHGAVESVSKFEEKKRGR